MNRPVIAANIVVSAASLSMLLTGCVIAPGPAASTPDGLVQVKSSRVDSLYVAPGLSLARYRRVLIDSVDVAFKQDWQARHPEVSADDVALIRHGAASLFRAEFTRELEKGGYAIVETPGADVLRVAASIVDLDIVAGASADPASPQYLVSTADLSLVSELRDSQSGAMLARAADRKRGRNQGNLQLSGQAAQTAEARAAFATWAGYLREALDGARAAEEAKGKGAAP
jgi:hypothetical protein